MTTNRVPDSAGSRQSADENHLPSRLLRMYKTGLLQAADAGPVLAHLAGCDVCATRLELLPAESSDALRAELLAKVLAISNEPAPLAVPDAGRATHEEVWGKDPARRPSSAQSPLAAAAAAASAMASVFFKIPDRASGLAAYAHAAAGKIHVEEATDAELAAKLERTPAGGIRIAFPVRYVGWRYRLIAEQFQRSGESVAEGVVTARKRRVEIQPSTSLDLLRDDGWRLRLTVEQEVEPGGESAPDS